MDRNGDPLVLIKAGVPRFLRGQDLAAVPGLLRMPGAYVAAPRAGGVVGLWRDKIATKKKKGLATFS